MKYKIFTVIALLGSTVAELFGGWDTALKTLLIFMVLDWLTGGIILPAVFRKSPKSLNGALESRAGWKGSLQERNDFIVCPDSSPSGYGSGSGIHKKCSVHRIYCK